jgi:hypothetical protein
MKSNANFCSNCGNKLDLNAEIRNCPQCGMDLAHSTHQPLSSSPVVGSLPFKNPRTAALIALIGGIFALPGIGHMYVRKLGTGAGILIGGFILYAIAFAIIISVTSTRAYEAQYSLTGNASPISIALMTIILVLVIGYIVLFVWQIFSASNLAKKFNRLAKAMGTQPW